MNEKECPYIVSDNDEPIDGVEMRQECEIMPDLQNEYYAETDNALLDMNSGSQIAPHEKEIDGDENNISISPMAGGPPTMFDYIKVEPGSMELSNEKTSVEISVDSGHTWNFSYGEGFQVVKTNRFDGPAGVSTLTLTRISSVLVDQHTYVYNLLSQKKAYISIRNVEYQYNDLGTPWSYSKIEGTWTRKRTAQNYKRKLEANVIHDWEYLGPKEITEIATRSEKNVIYTWIGTGNSKKSGTAVFTFSDHVKEEPFTETGGTRKIVCSRATMTLPAAGGNIITAQLKSFDYWDSELIQTPAISDVTLSAVGTGFTASVSGDTLTVGKDNNTSLYYVYTTLNINKEGFVPFDLKITQEPGVITQWSSCSSVIPRGTLFAGGIRTSNETDIVGTINAPFIWNGVGSPTGTGSFEITATSLQALTTCEGLSVRNNKVYGEWRDDIVGPARYIDVRAYYNNLDMGVARVWQQENELTEIREIRTLTIGTSSIPQSGARYTIQASGTINRSYTSLWNQPEEYFTPSIRVNVGSLSGMSYNVPANDTFSSRSIIITASYPGCADKILTFTQQGRTPKSFQLTLNSQPTGKSVTLTQSGSTLYSGQLTSNVTRTINAYEPFTLSLGSNSGFAQWGLMAGFGVVSGSVYGSSPITLKCDDLSSSGMVTLAFRS